jgi:hypothetical protein
VIEKCRYDDKDRKGKTYTEQAYESEKLSSPEHSKGDFEIIL